MMHINPKTLITLRKKAGWSAEVLAEQAGVGRATITRIENGHIASSRANTVKKLAKVLRCTPDELAAPPQAEQMDDLFALRRTTTVQMSDASLNSLWLMACRYGESTETILELAPLLFDIVARESLIERRQALAEVEAHREAIKAMSAQFPHLGERYTSDWDAEAFDHEERKSLNRNDLRGEFNQTDELSDQFFVPIEFDDERDNPFVAHLRKRCESIHAQGYEAPKIESISRWGAPDYELGRAEARALAGGDDEFELAILQGQVPIADISNELLKGANLAGRQQWMRERLEKNKERVSALFGGLSPII